MTAAMVICPVLTVVAVVAFSIEMARTMDGDKERNPVKLTIMSIIIIVLLILVYIVNH